MNRIKEILNEKGIKQTWLSKKLGKSFKIVNAYACNRQQPPLDTFLFSNTVSNRVDNQDSVQANDKVQNILSNQLHNRVEEILNVVTQWIKYDELLAGINLSYHPNKGNFQ